jgi:hypothetical protein
MAGAQSTAAAGHHLSGSHLRRAIANYEALLGGTRQLAALSPIEREEIEQLIDEVRSVPVRRGRSRERCIADQTASRGGRLTDLETRIVDLACSQH